MAISKMKLLQAVYENVQIKVKNFKQSKVSQSEKPGEEKALNFTRGIDITPGNYSFMPEKCFKLLFCIHLMCDTSHLSQQNIFSGNTLSLLDVSLVFCFTFYIL